MKRFVFGLFALSMIFVLSGCLTFPVMTTSPQTTAPAPAQPAAVQEQPAQQQPAQQAVQQSTPQPESVQVYELGERGPAGGIVFYDKGSYSDGWRFMELAPIETEIEWMKWGGHGIDVGETGFIVGTGKANTEQIVTVLGREDPVNHGPYPALVCDQLSYGGYDDWFLPSIDELLLVYNNLISQELSDFNDPGRTQLWSSSWKNGWITYLSAGNGGTSETSPEFLGVIFRAVRSF